MLDFLIIGGGIAGISAAARLSHLGSGAVLEMESGLGYHASGRSAAMFEETYGKPATVALNRASYPHLANADGGVLSPRGIMLIGTRETAADFAHDMKAMAMRPMPLDTALGMVPVLDKAVVSHVGYHAEAWDIDTDRLIQNFAREARANGTGIYTSSKAEKIWRIKGGWAVETSGKAGGITSPTEARILVNAAGAWADDVARMAGVAPVGLVPFRRSMARIPAPGGHDVSRWPMMFGPGENWYAKPDAGMLLVSPADETPTEPHDAWPEELTLAQGIARFEGVTTHDVRRIASSWAGLRTFSADRCLVLGPDPLMADFIWVAGQGGYGFQTSPAASQLVADLLAGRQSELDEKTRAALSPARFR